MHSGMAGRLQRPTRRRTWWAVGEASLAPSSSQAVSTGLLSYDCQAPASEPSLWLKKQTQRHAMTCASSAMLTL